MNAKYIDDILNEKFTDKSDPIQDMGIGIPKHKYAIIGWDWGPDHVVQTFKNSLAELGIYVTEDPTVDAEDSGVYAYILSKKKLTKEEINRIVEQRDEYGLDN